MAAHGRLSTKEANDLRASGGVGAVVGRERDTRDYEARELDG